jgi:protein-tyrosine phosphatase
MQTGRIDVHAHLLPGIDDGCATVDEALQCARTLVSAGYTHAFCTPHIWPSFPRNTIDNVRRWTADLQAKIDGAGIPLMLAPGGEINLMSVWPAMLELPREQIVTYAFASRYVLFDFWAEQLPLFFEQAVQHLRSLGLTPIMAHPERLIALNRGGDQMIDRVQELGVLLQMNTWCVTSTSSEPIREAAQRWLRDGRYFLMGTDTHNPRDMKSRIEGINVAERLVGRDVVDQLTRLNPLKLLEPA